MHLFSSGPPVCKSPHPIVLASVNYAHLVLLSLVLYPHTLQSFMLLFLIPYCDFHLPPPPPLPHLPSSIHPVGFSTFLFVLRMCRRLDSVSRVSPTWCFLAFYLLHLDKCFPSTACCCFHSSPPFSAFGCDFSTPSPSTGSFSSFPISRLLPPRPLSFRPPERVRRWR